MPKAARVSTAVAMAAAGACGMFTGNASAAGPASPAGAGVRALMVEAKAPSLWVRDGRRLVMEYRHGEVPYKPYVKQLCTPAGVNVLLDAPPDHLHHHGIMFAVAAGGVDFWAETPANGRQASRSLEVLRPTAEGGPAGGFAEKLDWLSPDGKLMLQERRMIEVRLVGDANATLLTWRSRLSCPPGAESVKLSGSHYFGLGMRFVRSMDKAAAFRTADGAPEKAGVKVRGVEHVTPSAWCACTGPVDGKPVTAAMFGHPRGPRFPVHWFTMYDPFAYLAATMNLWKEPLTIEKDRPLEVWYGAAFWDGKADDAAIAKLRDRWIEQTAAR